MKNLIIIGAIFLILVSCNKLDEHTQFDIDYTETITIPASTGLNLPFNLSDQELESNNSSTFENNNTNKDLIESAVLKQMQLNHRVPSNGDLSFINEITIFLEADGLPEIRIAWKENISDNVGKTIDLEVTDEDLKDYIKKDKLNIRVNSVTDEFLNDDHVIDVKTKFFIDAEVLGI